MDMWVEYAKLTFCDHAETRPTKAIKSNNTVCVYIQCAKCGLKLKEAPKKEYDVESLPPFDAALRDKTIADKEALLQQMQQERQEQAAREAAENVDPYRKRYDDYLQSEHWRTLRRKVIARDHFQCQNCFCRVTEGSAHVHHVSYDGLRNVGHSFAFECVTLCRTCHVDYHPHMQAEPSQTWQVAA